jgi:uncharacterized coiled-coil DUF342 family protein
MTPQEIGQYAAQAVTLIVALLALKAKKIRAPADDQARIDSGIAILNSQLERTEKAQGRWLDVEKYLREELDKKDTTNKGQREEIQRLSDLLRQTSEQLADLREERDELAYRIRNLASKYGRGETITLADIVGDDAEELELATK